MLPTLAERLREQQARSRSRPPSRQPWPLPSEPPTALLFQRLPPAAEPVAAPPAEPAAPTAPQTRTAQAEALLLCVWAVLVVIDGALALASLIDRLASRERRNPGELRQMRTTLAASSAGRSDSSRGPGSPESCCRDAGGLPLNMKQLCNVLM
ncbi:hypothetical protein [Cyanobium gracile]|uniref:Uncharacterized protein n=1 Tax=Cyanobium gracile UHCC 0281 TaxID=3110309 RepID=A0ABU5SS71_9CYAN|nr:hypothetical protein [Cyanobium gracile]MEA5441313.1 hypothetical protein [Cyanobium gracile UHCC 0281]